MKLIPKVSMLPFKVNYVVGRDSLILARFLVNWLENTRFAAVLGICLFNTLIILENNLILTFSE